MQLGDHERARIERDIRRNRRFVPVILREFLTWEEMARIEVNAPDLPGISVDMGTTRIYPEAEHLAHVVGYVAPPAESDVGDDPLVQLPGIRIGRAGVERYHDRVLRGRAGAVEVEVNAVGRVIRELDRREGIPGQDVQISIDTDLQKAVRAKISEGPRRCCWMRGTARCWPMPPSLPRSEHLQFRRVRRAVAAMDGGAHHAADQQGDQRPTRRVPPSRGGRAGPAEAKWRGRDVVHCPGRSRFLQ